MKKKLLSLLLVACMVLPMIPIMVFPAAAATAQSEENYSTTFSFDATNPNFPTFAYATKDKDGTDVAVKESGYYTFGSQGDVRYHNFSQFPIYNASATDGWGNQYGRKWGINVGTDERTTKITYNGGWEIGYNTVSSNTTVNNNFTPYNGLFRDTYYMYMTPDGEMNAATHASSVTITGSAGNIGTLTAQGNISAGTYLKVSAIRYTAEYSGTVTISASCAFTHAGLDNAALEIWVNGVKKGVIENKEGSATSATIEGIDVLRGDEIQFVSVLNMANCTTSDHAKGAKNPVLTVTYTERAIYSTEFSNDATNANFPSFEYIEVAADTTGKYLFGTEGDVRYHDFSVFPNRSGDYGRFYGVSDGTTKITYHGGWEIGDKTVSNGELTTAFTPYPGLIREGSHVRMNADGDHYMYTHSSTYNITDGGAMWAEISGGKYVRTPAIRYTAEHTGIINITASCGFQASGNADFEIWVGGKYVGEVTNVGGAASSVTLKGISVKKGDTVEFINAMHADVATNYQGVKNPVCAIDYTKFTLDTSYTTTFAWDPENENFPTFDFDQSGTKVQDSAHLVFGDYDFGYLPAGKTDAKITYHNNWYIGEKSVTTAWDSDKTHATGVTINSDFTLFDTLYRDGTITGLLVWANGRYVGNTSCYYVTPAGEPALMRSMMSYSTNTTKYPSDSASDANTRVCTDYTTTSAIRYICEYDGVVDITATVGAFTYANGTDIVVLYDGTEVARVENGVALTATKTALTVEKGKAIEFVNASDPNFDKDSAATYGYTYNYASGANRGARDVECTVTYTERKQTSSASLVISNAYAVNLYVDSVANGMTDCGVEINGVKLPATLQADGSYKVVAKEDIKVFELTGTPNASQLTKDPANEMDKGVEITYKPYETAGDTTVYGEEVTVCTRDLLHTYIDGNYDATTKELAMAIRALADASRVKFESGYILSHYVAKPYLKGNNGAPLVAGDSGYTLNGKILGTLKYYTYIKEGMTPEEALAAIGQSSGGNAFADPYTNADAATTGIANIEAGVTSPYAADPTDAKYAYKIVGANVNLGDMVSLVFLANGNNGNSQYDLKNYSIKVMNGSEEVEVANSGFKATEVNGKAYMGIIVDVPISLYDSDLTVTIVDGNGNEVSAPLTYSVTTWCVRNFDFATCTTESSNQYVLQGVYLLGKAAKAYVAAH